MDFIFQAKGFSKILPHWRDKREIKTFDQSDFEQQNKSSAIKYQLLKERNH